MRYLSTRGECESVSFTQAVATGLAPDGGLYLPETLPDLRPHLGAWSRLGYAELCLAFLKLFATDMPEATLRERVLKSYSTFEHGDVAPLVTLKPGLHVLELFHGPTLAFKDFALQLLGNLYEEQIRRTGEPINVLGATSGDTGSAAIHGLLGKSGVNIFILYPSGRVSPLQERQMTCTGAANVFPIAIDGTFDDAQAIVKDIFGDLDFRRRHHLSAVNSINLARILAQCVYYVWAWLRLPEREREVAEFVVPTGNFGNVLAGWLTQKMGLPIARFRVATNQNDILYRLFRTGVYEVGAVIPSLAPSMDIQVASNFERFMYYLEGRDPSRVRAVMQAFRKEGRHVFADFNADTFTASRATDAEIPGIIRQVYRDFHYVADPHTACGFAGLDHGRPSVVLSTAHPAKFPETILQATGVHATAPALEALKALPIVNTRMPASLESVRAFVAKHAIA